jgi:tRNA-specific 2-thiouridylase
MKVAVLLSGGVDSSVALQLLKNKNYDLTAYYLKIWLEDEFKYLGNCPFETDLEYAKKVCKQLNVPLKILSLQKEYWDKIVKYTLKEVKDGRTPNPDVLCNQFIKFGSFLEKLERENLEYDKIASGHYAKVLEKNNKYYLLSAPDKVKDQAYFLCRLSQEQLKKLIFPLGDLNKKEVRQIAEKNNLANKDRKDSQGICFLGKIPYREFLQENLGTKIGDILDYETNQVLGKHNGAYLYTTGQRKGLGLSGGPYYVVKKDVSKNLVWVSHNYQNLNRMRQDFEVKDFHWIPEDPQETDFLVKIRHGEEFYQASLEMINKDYGKVNLKKPDQGIASGQYCVFYNKEGYCLGSAVIV